MLGRKIGVARSAIYGASSYLDQRGHDPAADRHDWIGLDETLAHLPEYRWLEPVSYTHLCSISDWDLYCTSR